MGSRARIGLSIDLIICIKLLNGKMMKRAIILQLMVQERSNERKKWVGVRGANLMT